MATESDFELELLRDSVRRFVRERYSVEQRRALRDAAESGGKKSHWQAFAANGWLGAAFGEAYGGSAGGIPQMAAIAEELGRGLVTEPYLSNVLAGWLVNRLGTTAQKEQFLSSMIGGSIRMALVWNPTQALSGMANHSMQIRPVNGSLVLNGRQAVVAGGDADVLLAIARVEEAGRDCKRVCVFVPLSSPGVHVHAYRTVNDSGAADFVFENVQLNNETVLNQLGPSEEVLEEVFDIAVALTCCEALGTMSLAFDTTLAYLKQRSQFGHPLGQNQALQHRMVDMQILLRECEALTQQALHALEETEARKRALAVSAAKTHVNQTARRIGHEAIQMHGGIGTTDEALISHAFKHLMALRVQYGDTSWHQQRVARCLDYLPHPTHVSPKG